MSRRPQQLRRALAVGAVVAVVAVSAPLSRVQPPAQAATGEQRGAVVLPDGRLVRPEGRRFDLGDFPIGLAVSPDGRLAVAANAGRG